jgi:hypothetical protein
MPRYFFSIPILILFMAAFGLQAEEPPSGRAIMEMQKERHRAATEVVEETMVLVDKSGSQEVRQLRRYTKEVEADVYRLLLVFLGPPDIAGTALLTWQHAERADDQWLYLPARGKMQRIVEGARKSHFMGTDFSFEDLQSEKLDDFRYSMLRQEEEDGRPCYVVEAVPTAAVAPQSGYGKRLLWVDIERLVSVKVEFYDRRGKLLKTQTARGWGQEKKGQWRAAKVLMDSHRKKHKTLVGTQLRLLDGPIDDQTFTERFITSGRHLQD